MTKYSAKKNNRDVVKEATSKYSVNIKGRKKVKMTAKKLEADIKKKWPRLYKLFYSQS